MGSYHNSAFVFKLCLGCSRLLKHYPLSCAQTLFFLDRPMILGFKDICWSMFTVRTQWFIVLRHWKTAQVKLPPLTCNIWSVFSAFWMKALLCPWQPGSLGIILVIFLNGTNNPLILPTVTGVRVVPCLGQVSTLGKVQSVLWGGTKLMILENTNTG